MSSWFSRSRKPSGDGGNANERDDTTDRNGFENGRYTTVPDDDDGEARVDNNNINNNKSNIRSANRHVLNDFTIPDEEYDPDFEADLARAISESLSNSNKKQTQDESTPQSRYKNINNNNNNNNINNKNNNSFSGTWVDENGLENSLEENDTDDQFIQNKV